MTALVPWQHRLGGAIRRHPVASFLVWSFPVGQAIAFQPVLARAWYDVDLPTAPFVVGANLVGLLLPALVITRVVDGRAGVHALWERAVRVRVPLRWYGLALVVVPMATTATAVALHGPPEGTGWVLASALVAGLLVQLVLGFLTTNWAEEVAWTGFVQTRLQERHGPVRAAVATGPLFALQHVSLAYGNGWLSGMVVLVFITATAVPFRFLQGWVANRTGSLFVVGLVHAAGNATTDGSGFGGPGLLPRLFPDDAVGPVHLLASAALGLVVLAATRGRLGRPAARDIVSYSRPAGPPAVPVRRTGAVPVDQREPYRRATQHPDGATVTPVAAGRPLPAALALMEPWVDLTPPHPQAPGTEPADPVRSRRFLQPSAAARAGRTPLSGHRLSPLHGGDRPSRAASSNDHHPSKENVMSKRLSTQVDIEATPERVWEVLTDLAAYPEWNPFIVRAAGDVAPGRRLTLRMQPVGGRAMTLRPRLVEVAVHRELRWRGKLVVPGLMDAEHAFVLQPQAGGTRLIHRETFRGVLVPFAAASLDRNTLPAFVAMNEALKRRAEDPPRPRARTGAVDDRGTRS